MKRMTTLLLLVMLAGCDPTLPGYRNEWLEPCVIVAPPDGDTYIAASERGRNGMWGTVYINQAQMIAVCNTRIKEARAYLDEFTEK